MLVAWIIWGTGQGWGRVPLWREGETKEKKDIALKKMIKFMQLDKIRYAWVCCDYIKLEVIK